MPFERWNRALSLVDYGRALRRIERGNLAAGQNLLRRAIARSGDWPIHPHILLAKSFAFEHRFDLVLRKAAEITEIVDRLPQLNQPTRDYIRYYVYRLLPENPPVPVPLKKDRIYLPRLIVEHFGLTY